MKQHRNAYSEKIAIFQKEIIRYWDVSGRKELPWRKTRDPWKVLIAEMLLRKTASKQAIGIYGEISRYSAKRLAQIPIRALKKILRPIGLYNVRATQIHLVALRASSIRRRRLSYPNILKALPGAGHYTQNAVLCVAFGQPLPALDTNMIRVITRVFGFESKKARAREDGELWKFAETLVPKAKCREFNWGTLDLANAICTARSPLCATCPINGICLYYKETIKHGKRQRKSIGKRSSLRDYRVVSCY